MNARQPNECWHNIVTKGLRNHRFTNIPNNIKPKSYPQYQQMQCNKCMVHILPVCAM